MTIPVIVKVTIAVVGTIGALLAIAGVDLPSPPAWLMNWTTWLLAMIVAVFGPSVLQKLSK